MKTPKRLEEALIKLYNAFHNNELNPECCTACAVGNILDNHDSWKYLSEQHGSLQLSYIGKVHQRLNRKFNGYSPLELLKVEKTFLDACGFKTPLSHYNPKPKIINKDILFNGLQAVVCFLCELDGIHNSMNYSKIFEFEDENPVYGFNVIYQ